ncbi:NlpC/P60 family protein [Candidatus Neomarinimicrobiota bacterium]
MKHYYNKEKISVRSRFTVMLMTFACIPIMVSAQAARPQIKALIDAVGQIKQQYAPDTRVEVFQIEVKDKGSQFVITGELADRAIKTALFEALSAEAGGGELADSVKILPDEQLLPEAFGIVKISVANLRRQPTMKTELISQTLLGTVVKILKEEDGFYYIQNWDHYLGWISRSSVIRVDSETAENWRKGPRVIATAVYGVVRKERKEDAEILVDLVPGVVLQKVSQKGNWTRVRLPDNREGYVKTDVVMDESGLQGVQATGDRLVSVAREYLGIPYLWGGTSCKAFDCSGFIQTVYRMNNRELPRDANQMVKAGEPVEFGEDYENLRRGDLLFFGPSPDRITHVALYMGKKLFIHSSGWVHINSLDREHPLYNEYRYSTIRTARRHLSD